MAFTDDDSTAVASAVGSEAGVGAGVLMTTTVMMRITMTSLTKITAMTVGTFPSKTL